jgi:phenylacetate-CoA ligase
MQTETLSPFYQIEVFREGSMDSMTVNVEASPPLMEQPPEARDKVAQKVIRDIKDFIGVSCRVVVKGVGEVPRSEGKAVRVIDHRKK